MGEWPDDIDIPAQVFVQDNPEASEIAARDEFNRNNPPIRGLVVPDDLRKIELVKRPWRNNKGLWFELAENRILFLPPRGVGSRRQLGAPPSHYGSRDLHRQGPRLLDRELRGAARGAHRLAGGDVVLAAGLGMAPAFQQRPERDRALPGSPGHRAHPAHALPPDRAPPDAAEDRGGHRLRGRRGGRAGARGGVSPRATEARPRGTGPPWRNRPH